MKKIAVVLSGCGVFDGSEIHESVLTLLNIKKQNASYSCFAIDKLQTETINHLNKSPEEVSRNVIHEAARIARGNISELDKLDVNDFDAIIFPGGLGVIKNLSDFATKGVDFNIDPLVQKVLTGFYQAKKPVGLICIAPILATKVYPKGTVITIGSDPQTAKAIEAIGLTHQECACDQIAVDTNVKLVTTPAYMLANNILESSIGIEKLVAKVINFID